MSSPPRLTPYLEATSHTKWRQGRLKNLRPLRWADPICSVSPTSGSKHRSSTALFRLCRNTVVRIGPFKSDNESAPFENPRNFGCWRDADGDDGAPYSICKKNATSKVTGSSRFFYYEPEVSPTPPPSSTTTVTASMTQGTLVKGLDGEAAAAERRRHPRPDRHA